MGNGRKGSVRVSRTVFDKFTMVFSFLLSVLALLAAVRVITVVNPVHAVFSLVLVFVLTSVLRLLLSREFRALVFIRVYVGAIAVLFLFVVRRLNVEVETGHESFVIYLLLGVTATLFLLGVFGVDTGWNNSLASSALEGTTSVATFIDRGDPLSSLGQVLYTVYCAEFLVAGLVLLVARVGAIVLTLTHVGSGHTPLRQQVHQQHARDSNTAIFKIY